MRHPVPEPRMDPNVAEARYSWDCAPWRPLGFLIHAAGSHEPWPAQTRQSASFGGWLVSKKYTEAQAMAIVEHGDLTQLSDDEMYAIGEAIGMGTPEEQDALVARGVAQLQRLLGEVEGSRRPTDPASTKRA